VLNAARAAGATRLWCVLALVLVSLSLPAQAAAPYVDHRVSALSSTALLHDDVGRLVDPRRQEAASELAFDERALFFVWAFSQIIALLALWRSGAAAGLRAALRRALKNGVLVRFVFGGAVATVASLASLPASLLRYHTALIYDLDHEPFSVWSQRALESWGLNALAFGILTAFVYTLVARTRLWYLYALPGLLGFVLIVEFVQPVFVLPLFDRVRPLSPVAFPAGVAVVERKTDTLGIPFLVDHNASRSALATASVVGFGATKRIVVTDTLLGRATDGEVTFVVAREVSHYVHADGLRSVLAETIAFVLAIALGVLAADRIPFRRDDDALSRLPLVAAMLGVAALLILPFYHTYARSLERHADQRALALAGDRAAAVQYFVRLADESLTPLCPARFDRWYFSVAPPLGTRAATAQGRPDPCR